ncbi:MAG: ComF family protein [Candidatus Eisenbacteria bacterium]|nr:ComF family protein [Candidatus Eisenbacteria bacterium]
MMPISAIAWCWRSLLDCFAPVSCPLCGRRLGLEGECRPCGLPDPGAILRQLRKDGEGEFLILAGGAYEGAHRRLVHAYKYRREPGALDLLAAQAAFACGELGPWELLVPVAAHPRRLRERGWEPAGELAGAIARCTGLPVARLLRRVRDTPPLAGQSARARRSLVREAFRGLPAHGRLLVVDDVATTGSTFRACRRALLDAGAGSVDLLVAAATPRHLR